MIQWQKNVQAKFKLIQSKIRNVLNDEKEETPFHEVTIELDSDSHKGFQRMARRMNVTEEEVLLNAVREYVETRTLVAGAKLTVEQKENNPLFHLEGLTQQIK